MNAYAGFNPQMFSYPQPDAQSQALTRANALSGYDQGKRKQMAQRADNMFGGDAGSMRNYDAMNAAYEQAFSLGGRQYADQSVHGQNPMMQMFQQMMGMFNPMMFNYGQVGMGGQFNNQQPQQPAPPTEPVSTRSTRTRRPRDVRRFWQPGIGRR